MTPVEPAARLRLHHVGVLVADVAAATERYVRRFGYEVRSELVHDPVQTAFVQFLGFPGDSVYLEFVAPDGAGSKLSNALKKGGGPNHLCYSTPHIDEAVHELLRTGMLLLQAPVMAVVFRGRKIAWLMGTDSVPIELVERGPDNEI